MFLNPKIEIEVFSYIICSLDFKNISCALFLLYVKTFRSTYWLSITYLILLRLFRFFLFFSFILNFFMTCITC